MRRNIQEGDGTQTARRSSTAEPALVLLVEDDEGDAVLVQDLLAAAAPHLEVLRVGTLREAEEALPGGIDCVLLDLGLPDGVGLGPVERLRAAAEDTAVVVLTGDDDDQRGIAAVARGAQDYFAKGGLDGAVLARAIRYAIERRRAERSQQELLQARLAARENARLERGLLPTALVRDPRIVLTTAYRPGRRRALLGGDFYDAVELGDGTLHAIIGDVSGHGPDEAALGATLRIAWRTLTLARLPPKETLCLLQAMLVHERHEAGMFATLAIVTVAPRRDRGELFLAGHPPPVLIDGHGLRLLEVEHVSPPLGFVDPGEWQGNPVAFAGDWALLLYTDGLIEGRIGEGSERLGPRRLTELLARHGGASVAAYLDNAPPLLDALVENVEELHGGDLTDDLAMVLLTSRNGA